ncbi:hypothetical protein GCM10022205_35490 [Spinactinospora alkalitolerans]
MAERSRSITVSWPTRSSKTLIVLSIEARDDTGDASRSIGAGAFPDRAPRSRGPTSSRARASRPVPGGRGARGPRTGKVVRRDSR